MTDPCDSPCAYLLMINIPAEDWCAAVDPEPRIIGRSRHVHVPVPHRFTTVSRRHAEVRADGRGARIRDIGSTHGTRVNGVWIERDREVSIAPGDRIWLGGVDLEVVDAIATSVEILLESGVVSPPENFEDTCIRNSTMPLPTQLMLGELSQAELEIVLWMGRGLLTDDELGKKLHRSPHTVRTQVNSIFRKLDVHSRGELIALLQRK